MPLALLGCGLPLPESAVERARAHLDWSFRQWPGGGSDVSGFPVTVDSCSGGGACVRKGENRGFEGLGVQLQQKAATQLYHAMQILIAGAAGAGGAGTPPEAWAVATRTLADGFARLWAEQGQFGHYVDSSSGKLLLGSGHGAVQAAAGLALAAGFFENKTYATVAAESASALAKNVSALGYSVGGAADILFAPEVTSAWYLVATLVTLYETQGGADWLEAAVEASHLFASWAMDADYPIPRGTPYGDVVPPIATTGSLFASVQNREPTPGICTGSPVELWRLWRYLGGAGRDADAEDALALLRPLAHNVMQYVSRAGRPLPGQECPGCVGERVPVGDALGPVGTQYCRSCPWSEWALASTAAQIPGVYVLCDTQSVVVFDHVEAAPAAGGGAADAPAAACSFWTKSEATAVAGPARQAWQGGPEWRPHWRAAAPAAGAAAGGGGSGGGSSSSSSSNSCGAAAPWQLLISNPTAFDALVAVFVEAASDRARVLPPHATATLQRVLVRANASTAVLIGGGGCGDA